MKEYLREGMEKLNELFPQYYSENLEMIVKAQTAIDLSLPVPSMRLGRVPPVIR